MAFAIQPKRISVVTTAVQVYSTAQTIFYGVQIRLGTEATGRLAIGNSNVTCETTVATDGYQLAAGDSAWIPKEVAGDLTGLYLIATGASQNVYIMAM